MKKVQIGMAKVFGWFLLILNSLFLASAIFCIPYFLTLKGTSWLDRIVMSLCSLLFSAVFACLWYLGYRLKSRKKPKAPQAIRFRSRQSARKASPGSVAGAIPETNAPVDDYPDNATIIEGHEARQAPAASEQAPVKPAPAKAPEKTHRAETAKLNLGSYSFSDADRQKLMALPKQGLPEKTDTADAQLALLDALDAVMNTTVVRLKTDSGWNISAEMPEEEKTNRFRGNLVSAILAVEASLSALNPDFLTQKVENADFDPLLNAWAVLNYYAGVVKREYTENIRHFRDYIHNVLLTRYGGSQGKHLVPAKLEGTGIYVNSRALTEWLKCNRLAAQYQLSGVMPLAEKEPVITLYEDGVMTREYRLETEKDEDFTGKYFQISIRMGMQGDPSVPVAQIDGFISDTPEDREMTLQDVGYRFEGHFLAYGGESTKKRQEMNLGQDLPMKALKYAGYTTPSNVRLIGICPECGKSFCFHGYGFYMGQNEVAYSDDGLDCCQVSAHNVANEDWKCEVDGKTFRYYNSFCCPHCGTPYIDYRKFPENKKFGVSGCVHLGRKVYYDTDAAT